jgi:hypothetical protein
MMLKLWSCVLIAGLSTSAVAQGAGSAKADIPANQIVTAANGASARCMARTTTKHDGHDWDFVVPVPSDKQAEFATKGFQPVACGQLIAQLASHKRFVCEIAQGNEAVQAQTEAQLGIDAKKLCAAAKALLPDAADQSSAAN